MSCLLSQLLYLFYLLGGGGFCFIVWRRAQISLPFLSRTPPIVSRGEVAQSGKKKDFVHSASEEFGPMQRLCYPLPPPPSPSFRSLSLSYSQNYFLASPYSSADVDLIYGVNMPPNELFYVYLFLVGGGNDLKLPNIGVSFKLHQDIHSCIKSFIRL